MTNCLQLGPSSNDVPIAIVSESIHLAVVRLVLSFILSFPVLESFP